MKLRCECGEELVWGQEDGWFVIPPCSRCKHRARKWGADMEKELMASRVHKLVREIILGDAGFFDEDPT